MLSTRLANYIQVTKVPFSDSDFDPPQSAYTCCPQNLSAYSGSLTQMSTNGSVPDLSASMQNLTVEPKKKKRTQRAFHATFTQPPPITQQQPLGSPYVTTPVNQQLGFFTPADAQTFAHANGLFTNFNSEVHTPVNPKFSPAPVVPNTPVAFHGAPIVPSSPAVLNVTTPHDIAAQNQSSDLSLSGARHQAQEEYSTPQYDAEGNKLGFKSFLSFQNIVPPIAGTQYHAVDQGTATPKHIRSTMYNVPESEALRKATKLPIAVTIRPFAPLLSTEEPVPTVDMSGLGSTSYTEKTDIGPPRCNRCRTYINPSMMHTAAGKFTCNICQFPNNTVPPEYVSMLNPMTNQRIDRESRAELHKGVYDIIVPSYYNVGGEDKAPSGLHHVFLVDISHQSIIKQLPVLVADAIRAAIFDYSEDYDSDTLAAKLKFAVILFDKSMHFYNLSPALSTCQISVSGDLEDPFIPFHEGLFADPEESRMVIEDALNNLEMLCNENVLHDTEPCFSVAIRTAAMCLDLVGGGKITSILSTLPSWGPGGSKLKENRNVGRSALAEMEKKLYSADNEYYKLLATDLVAQNVGLDVFVVATTSVDVSNIGWLASVTGGSIYKWANFNFERDGRSLTSQIVNSVKKCTGYQGQLKLRCSNGLQVSQYYGFPSNSDTVVGLSSSLPDPVIPVLNEDQTFTVLLEYDGTLNTKYDCHFQAALLYTDPQGVRKVRVINLVLAVSERLQDVFNFVDQDAVVTTIVRDTLSFVGKESISELRKSVNEKLVDVFTLYRAMSEENHNRNATLTNQLIFPDSLKHLPAYFLALDKSKALRDSTAVHVDARLCDVFQMLYMPVERLVYHLYPAMVELHSMLDDDALIIDDTGNTSGFMKVPEYKPLTNASLDSGVYILCNGSTIYVRVHPDTNRLLLKDLFGDHVEAVNDIDPLIDSLPELPTHISQQARHLVKYFQEHLIGSCSIGNSAIQVVRDGIDSLSYEFRECLVEDHLPSKTVNTSPSYPEFLQSLHGAIRGKVEFEKKNLKRTTNVQHLHDTLAQRLIHF